MKTPLKFALAVVGLTLVAGTVLAQTETTPPQPWRPGWHHEQMVQAFKDGKAPMMGPGMMMRGPDGKIDPSQLPPWCPYRQTPPASPQAEPPKSE